MKTKLLSEYALEQGNGILRLAPNWVPREFCVPGRRIKLHPDDYFALGGKRGGIDERWFSSTTPADNGPLTGEFEGMSFVVAGVKESSELVLLKDVIEDMKEDVVGEKIWNTFHGWPMFSKFFDNKKALPFHIHHDDTHASNIGQLGKPEAYYFSPQVNNYGGDFPYTFFGFNPGTTKDELRQCLIDFTKGDNHITSISRAFRLDTGTGWDVPPGVLHAPGSLCTYEPQRASDVYAMYESLTGDAIVDESLLWKDCPLEYKGDFDYLIDMVDWDMNTDPDFKKNRFMLPIPVIDEKEMQEEGYIENWIIYKSNDFSAKELTVLPGRTVSISDNAPYGLIILQGHGTLGKWEVESPALIRFGQLTFDEFFVSESAAKSGVTISNPSSSDPIVMLKHFGPENPDLIKIK